MKDKPSITKQMYPFAMAYTFVLAALFTLGSGMSFHSQPSTAYQKDTISQQASIVQPASGHVLTDTDQWSDVDFSSAGAVHSPRELFSYTNYLLKPTGERYTPILPVKRFILYSCLKLGDYTSVV